MRSLARKQTEDKGQELEEVRRLFQQWRQRRKLGTRIPAELWEAAVSLFPCYTVNQISRELRLDFVILKKRISNGTGSKKSEGATGFRFWEFRLPDSRMNIQECRLRAEDGSGRKVELELKDIGAEPLLQLLGGLWGQRQ